MLPGDAAAEFGFKERARKFYETELGKMDEKRGRGYEINENYYDTVLLGAEKFCLLRPRRERYLENELRCGNLPRAASICDTLDRSEKAEKYRNLSKLVAA